MINRLLRWIGLGLAGLAVIGISAYTVVYMLSERALSRTCNVPAVAISIPTDPASSIEGQRLATIRGCYGGCHGKEAGGVVMFDEPMIRRVVAPNLTAAVRRYSDVQLAGVIRHGVRPGGRSMVVMPAEAFVLLTDAYLGRIIAFLKSLPAIEGPGPSVSLGPLGRIGVAIGQYRTVAQLIAATPDFTSPSLQVVAAYSPAAFTQLLRTGVALGGRNLATKRPWARKFLAQLTDPEIAALYRYLHTLPDGA